MLFRSGNTSGREFPIFNAATLLSTPDALHICVSDMSGPDGIAYYCGPLDSDNPSVFSRQWRSDEVWHSSVHGELKALHEYLLNTTTSHCMVVWVTDSLAGAYILNKGSCNVWCDLELLTCVFEIADTRHLQLVALWVPRELNRFADYLSHLAVFFNRPEIKLLASQLSTCPIYGIRASSATVHDGITLN